MPDSYAHVTLQHVGVEIEASARPDWIELASEASMWASLEDVMKTLKNVFCCVLKI